MSSSFGGVGFGEGVTMGAQTTVQILSVLITIVWSAIVSLILYKLLMLSSASDLLKKMKDKDLMQQVTESRLIFII